MSIIDKLKNLLGGAASNGDPSGEGGEEKSMVGVEGEMISCHDAVRLVHDYLDGELADIPQAQVKAHFEVCQACYPHLHLETVFREALRRAAAGQTAPEELKNRVLSVLAEADAEE